MFNKQIGYYRYVLPKSSWEITQGMNKSRLWFIMHFSLMLGVSSLGVFSFTMALFSKDWSLFDPTNEHVFTHSMFGIFTIAFSLIQVFNLIFFIVLTNHS